MRNTLSAISRITSHSSSRLLLISPLIASPHITSSRTTQQQQQQQLASSRLGLVHRHFASEMAPNGSTAGTTSRLTELRKLMKHKQVDIYVVPSEDAHQSEYVCAADKRREFISGFTGSAGTAVITEDKAALFTDGRYFNQAAKQLDDNWQLMKVGLIKVPTWQEWVADISQDGKSVGVDPAVITADSARELKKKLKNAGKGKLVAVEGNLVDSVWGKERPHRPEHPVFVLPEKFTGKPFQEKLSDLRKELAEKKTAGMVVSMLDEVAWLFNLRGSDIDYNPVFFAYALVTPEEVTLYINESKLPKEVKDHLEGVKIAPYDDIFGHLKVLGEPIDGDAVGGKIFVSNKCSWALTLSLGENKVAEGRSPVQDAKAVKNEVEQEGMRQCHIRDGTALVEYFAWLENELLNEKKLDEVEVADKLEQIRSKTDLFVGLSFDTISATGPNGAVIHYKPEKETCAIVDLKQIYLCDSGAQFKDGTTDTTRTISFSTPTPEQSRAYTLVLKGHIAIDRAVFPKGTTGLQIDSFARQYLWAEGLDYFHGTGHGVGSFLNVHEGPAGIGPRIAYSEAALKPGMVLSNGPAPRAAHLRILMVEPGFYKDGDFGIRIENVVIVKEVDTPNQFGDRPYYGFERVTMVPMDRRLIDVMMLDDKEVAWVNAYHEEVWNKISPRLEKGGLAWKWLERECKALSF